MQASRQSVKANEGFHFNGSSFSTGFQVYLSKCWDSYVSPGCRIQLDFCSVVFLPYFSMLILSLPLLGLGSAYIGQFDKICWELNFISEFFAFFWLMVWADRINECGWCLEAGRGC